MIKYCFALFFIGFSLVALAGIEDDMDAYLGTMTTTNVPSAYTTAAGRGVMSFGGMSYKHSTANANVFSYVPPSVATGCGGIDVNLGSMSFINADEIIQLGRDIAANTPMYAFNLSFGSLCQGCLAAMNKLADQARTMSRYLGDACRMAEGITTIPEGEGVEKLKLFTDLEQMYEGVEDAASGVGEAFGFIESVQDVKAAGGYGECEFNTNLFWCAAKTNNLIASLSTGSDDLLQELMTLFGTVVISDVEAYNTPSGRPADGTIPYKIYRPKLNFFDLLDGKKSQSGVVAYKYTCPANSGATECTVIDTATTDYPGLSEKLRGMLVGNDDVPFTDSIVYRFHHNLGTLTTSEQNLIGNLPHSIGAMLRRLSVKNPSMAKAFVERHVDVIARDVLEQIVKEYIVAIQDMDLQEHLPFYRKYRDLMDESISTIYDDMTKSYTKYGTTAGIIDDFAKHIDLLYTDAKYFREQLLSPGG